MIFITIEFLRKLHFDRLSVRFTLLNFVSLCQSEFVEEQRRLKTEITALVFHTDTWYELNQEFENPKPVYHSMMI